MFKKEKTNSSGNEGVETIVGPSVKLEGDFVSKENISVFGNVSGKINTEGDLNIGENASLKADLIGENIVIAGRVEGNVKAKNRLEITSSGKVYGDIEAKILTIDEGAVFTGNCNMSEERTVESEKEPKKEE